MRRYRAWLSLLAALWLTPLLAAADSAPPAADWPVERNAQQLRANEWKIGLFGLDVGVHERLQLGTLWPTWAIAGPNVHLKALLLSRRGWSFAGEVSFFYVRLDNLRWYGVDDVTGHALVLPVELFVDKQIRPNLLLGLGAGYAVSRASPKYDPESFRGAGSYDSLLLRGQLTARVHPKVWLVLEVDWVLFQAASGVGTVDTQLTDTIHVRGRAESIGDPIDPARGGALTLSTELRARHVGVRFGLGFGNWVLPRLRLAVPVAAPFVVIDLFARFGGRRTDR